MRVVDYYLVVYIDGDQRTMGPYSEQHAEMLARAALDTGAEAAMVVRGKPARLPELRTRPAARGRRLTCT
jgi:anthranilate phosphoribosyltransferase